uniref:Uncharacterized protein n=1 Tax=Sphaerodactylus townsendi TaxID=933632 RepID=A0ACB8G064_9SAUR
MAKQSRSFEGIFFFWNWECASKGEKLQHASQWTASQPFDLPMKHCPSLPKSSKSGVTKSGILMGGGGAASDGDCAAKLVPSHLQRGFSHIQENKMEMLLLDG